MTLRRHFYLSVSKPISCTTLKTSPGLTNTDRLTPTIAPSPLLPHGSSPLHADSPPDADSRTEDYSLIFTYRCTDTDTRLDDETPFVYSDFAFHGLMQLDLTLLDYTPPDMVLSYLRPPELTTPEHTVLQLAPHDLMTPNFKPTYQYTHRRSDRCSDLP